MEPFEFVPHPDHNGQLGHLFYRNRFQDVDRTRGDQGSVSMMEKRPERVRYRFRSRATCARLETG